MPHEQTIHDAVVKVCKEVMQLKKGCKVIAVELRDVTSNRPDEDVDYDELGWHKDEEYEYEILESDIVNSKDKVPCIHTTFMPVKAHVVIKILGSPITLSMILRTINKPIKRYTSHPTVHIDLINVLERWDLTHDTLEAQSPETKQFLAELLK